MGLTSGFLLTATGALIAGSVVTPLVRKLALHWGVTDRPDGHRKLQDKPIPLGGGVAVFLSLWATILAVGIASPWWRSMFLHHEELEMLGALFLASLSITALGLADDRFGLRGRHKLLGQIGVALILVGSGLIVRNVQLFGHQLDLGLLAWPCTVLWLVGAMNALNLIDGIDGVATCVGIILSATIAAMAAMNGRYVEGLFMITLAGSLAGFLRYNFPPARMYLGDAGSMLIGLVVGALAIRGSLKGPATVALAAPLAVWTIPFLDTMAAILRRKLTGRSIYETDRGHLHHRLLEKSGSKRRVLTWIGLACAATGIGTLVSVSMKNDAFAILTSLAVIAILAATKIFGHVELLLLSTKLKNLGMSFLSLSRREAKEERQTQVRLQGTRSWDVVWESLLESIDKLDLSMVRLDLNMPAHHENYHCKWESPFTPDPQKTWRAEVPLVVGDRVIGKLTITGQHDGNSACDAIAQLMDMLEPFESQMCELTSGTTLSKDIKADFRLDRAPTIGTTTSVTSA